MALLAVALGEARSWVANAGGKLFALPVAALARRRCLVRPRLPSYLEGTRGFGGRGLAVCVLAAAIIGPPRDYCFAATFPAWMVFSAGIAPVLAVATIYALLVVVSHAVMRLVAGPAQGDLLARRLSGAEKNGAGATSGKGSQ